MPTYEEYARMRGARASRLKLMDQSPLHYLRAYDNETAERGKLRAIHALVLEPDTFTAQFAVFEGRRAGKAYEAFKVENDGKTILNPREYAAACDVRDAIMAHPVASALISSPGPTEETVLWQRDDGLDCKARLDKLITGWGVDGDPEPINIVDLKTYGTTDPRQIARRVVQLGAHIQAAHYIEGVAITRQIPEESIRYLLIVAEDKAPFDVAVVELTADGALRIGREKREELLAKVLDCERSGKWPGRCPEIVPLELPVWVDQIPEEFTGGDTAEEES
jgi:hypothetical protein